MATIRIGGVQMAVGPAKKDNLPKILAAIQEGGCDILVFPEMALTGHNDAFGDIPTLEAWDKIAAACRHHYVTAIVGTGSRAEGKVYNQARIFSDHGEAIGTQEKLIPTEDERKWCVPGGKLATFTRAGLSFGCLVGNDLWVAPGFGPYPDPRLSHQLAAKGVDILFHINDSGTDLAYAEYYLSNLRLRAREAKVPIVTVNAAQPGEALNVASGIMSATGEWMVTAPLTGEQRFRYDLDIVID
jgi:predicted amidohydrolase